MCRAKPLLLSLLTLSLLLGSPALGKDPVTPAQGKTTIGEFALKVVQTTQDDPTLRASLSQAQAVAELQKAGFRFQGTAGDPLTEKDKSAFFFAVAKGLMDKMAPAPDGFETCAAETSVPECKACCLALPGASNQSCGRACGRNHADQQHASESEPTP